MTKVNRAIIPFCIFCRDSYRILRFSIAQTDARGKFFFRQTAMHPDPVPISRIETGSFLLCVFSFIIISISSSVSALE